MGKRKFLYNLLNPTTNIDFLNRSYDITELEDIYDEIEIVYKPNDKNFLIHNLVGKVIYPDNYKKCKKDKH